MSLDYMTLAWRTELQAGPRLILLAICDNANDDGNCYPSIQSLSLKSGLSPRAVRGHVASLDEAGIVERHERAGRSTYYQVNLRALRAAVFKSLSARTDLSEYDKGVLRSCAPDESGTPADSAPLQKSPITPADSAADPSRFLPTPPADSAAITNKEPTRNQQEPKKRASASTFELPDWINRQHWDAWHSCAKRKNASDAQKQMAVDKLDSWRKQGIDHAAALENAAIAGWQGLFKPDVPSSAMTPGRRQAAPSKYAAAAATIYDGVNL